jgi:hypothetical protein
MAAKIAAMPEALTISGAIEGDRSRPLTKQEHADLHSAIERHGMPMRKI